MNFFKDVINFLKTLKAEFFRLQYPSFNQTVLYVVGVVAMLVFFSFFLAIIDSIFGYLITLFFRLFA